MRFDARHIGSGVWGIFDAGVIGWRATDLSEDDAQQQAADLNVTSANGARKIVAQSTRRSRCSQPHGQQPARSIGGSGNGANGWVAYGVQTDVKSGSKLLIFVRQRRANHRDLSLSFIVRRAFTRCRNKPVDHLAAALAYASAGIHVFPLAPRSKVPLIPARNGGRGLHDATTDPDVIRSWWRAHPTANLGLRTGLSFDVIDLDSEGAVDALEDARGGQEPIQGPVVRTGHGFHWYVKPTGVGNRAGVLPGVDFRGWGGYVLGPPSVHPQGHRYCWINPLREELAPAPDWLMQLLVPERGPERPRAVPEVQGLRTPSAASRASAPFPGKGRHSQPPAQYSFIQYAAGWSRPEPSARKRPLTRSSTKASASAWERPSANERWPAA